MTYEEWFGLYLSLYKTDLKPKTRESYQRIHALVSPALGGLELSQITADHVQAAVLAAASEAGSRQAQLAYTLIHACLRRACRSRHLLYNPADAVDRPSHQTQQGRAISETDWPRLRPVILSDLAFALMAFAGLRRGEALGLRWNDVDLHAGVIHIRRQLVRVDGQLQEQTTKSAAGRRDVPIDAQLLPLLRASFRLDRRRIVACAPETLARRWRRAQEDAGIMQPYRLHDLRHTYATRYMLAGCNLKVLQYMIGHSSYELTVNTYAHVGVADAVAEVRRLAGSLH